MSSGSLRWLFPVVSVTILGRTLHTKKTVSLNSPRFAVWRKAFSLGWNVGSHKSAQEYNTGEGKGRAGGSILTVWVIIDWWPGVGSVDRA